MFAEAIKEVGGFTRPILTISRTYHNNVIQPGSGTLFFVNDEGCAVTTKHIVQALVAADQINERYAEFKSKLEEVPVNKRKATRKMLDVSSHSMTPAVVSYGPARPPETSAEPTSAPTMPVRCAQRRPCSATEYSANGTAASTGSTG